MVLAEYGKAGMFPRGTLGALVGSLAVSRVA